MPGPKPKPPEARFWPKVIKADGNACWEWQGSITPDGYGSFGISSNRQESTHRVSWRITNGSIPEGMWVLHKCDNRKCCRPDHLFLGNRRDNIDDMLQKGRQNRGSINGQSKLSEVQVADIRRQSRIAGFSQKRAAAVYGVRPNLISRVVSNKLWKHVGENEWAA